MAADPKRQERIAAVFMSLASIGVAAMEYLGRPEPGDFVEAEPDWYVTFTAVIHGAILVLLLVALIRLPAMLAGRPALWPPFLALILLGMAAAAYVLGRDLGMV